MTWGLKNALKKMEAEIHWEVECPLSFEENTKLHSIIESLPDLVEKFEFLKNRDVFQPLHLNVIIIDDAQMINLNATYRKKK